MMRETPSLSVTTKYCPAEAKVGSDAIARRCSLEEGLGGVKKC